MAHGDEIFQSVKLADGNRQHQHHREAGINRARNKVGRENGRVPSRNNATEKSKLTTVCTESTSGVASPASNRYAVS